jgi:hypothetical protein
MMRRIREGPTSATSKPGPTPLSQRQRLDTIYRATSDLGGRPSYLDSRLHPHDLTFLLLQPAVGPPTQDVQE